MLYYHLVLYCRIIALCWFFLYTGEGLEEPVYKKIYMQSILAPLFLID